MNNSQRKKLDAFYHNQQIDYDKWLMKNTMNQQRQRYVASKRTIMTLVTTLAMSAGLIHEYLNYERMSKMAKV